MTHESALEDYLDYPEPDDGIDAPKDSASQPKAPNLTLGRHLLEAAMTTAQLRRFRHSPGICVLIEAPTPAWVAPLRSAAVMMAAWHHAEGRDGIKRVSQKASEGEEQIALTLGAGQRHTASVRISTTRRARRWGLYDTGAAVLSATTVLGAFRWTPGQIRPTPLVVLPDMRSKGIGKASAEVLAEAVRAASHRLGEVVGRIAPDDYLDEIFSSFCIGK